MTVPPPIDSNKAGSTDATVPFVLQFKVPSSTEHVDNVVNKVTDPSQVSRKQLEILSKNIYRRFEREFNFQKRVLEDAALYIKARFKEFFGFDLQSQLLPKDFNNMMLIDADLRELDTNSPMLKLQVQVPILRRLQNSQRMAESSNVLNRIRSELNTVFNVEKRLGVFLPVQSNGSNFEFRFSPITLDSPSAQIYESERRKISRQMLKDSLPKEKVLDSDALLEVHMLDKFTDDFCRELNYVIFPEIEKDLPRAFGFILPTNYEKQAFDKLVTDWNQEYQTKGIGEFVVEKVSDKFKILSFKTYIQNQAYKDFKKEIFPAINIARLEDQYDFLYSAPSSIDLL